MRARLTAEQAEEKIERLETQLAVLEHALYLALVAPCEIYLRLDPCPAMRLADDVARSVMRSLPVMVEALDKAMGDDEERVKRELKGA